MGAGEVARRVAPLRPWQSGAVLVTLVLGAWLFWDEPPEPLRGPWTVWRNERGARRALESVARAQRQFRREAAVDQDSDGAGEFGWLG